MRFRLIVGTRDHVCVDVWLDVAEHGVVDAYRLERRLECPTHRLDVCDERVRDVGWKMGEMLVVVPKRDEAAPREPLIVIEPDRRHLQVRDGHPEREPAGPTAVAERRLHQKIR